jgi:hypothetical protein
MRLCATFLLLLTLAACGSGGPNEQQKEQQMQASARVAERNLQKIRDALLAYHRKHGSVPQSVDDLAAFGAGPEQLEPSDDYADLGYSFYSLQFNGDGTLKQGWLIASPRADRDALRVRMNAVNGAVDYTRPGEAMDTAPGEPKTDPPANRP